MSDTLQSYDALDDLTTKLRHDLESKDTVLIYAHNGTGKTRLCMNFKDKEKDTLYYNAFTEDLCKQNTKIVKKG